MCLSGKHELRHSSCRLARFCYRDRIMPSESPHAMLHPACLRRPHCPHSLLAPPAWFGAAGREVTVRGCQVQDSVPESQNSKLASLRLGIRWAGHNLSNSIAQVHVRSVACKESKCMAMTACGCQGMTHTLTQHCSLHTVIFLGHLLLESLSQNLYASSSLCSCR